MPKDKLSAAVLIHDAAKMTPKGRREIALWLRRQGAALLRDGHKYSRKFTAGWWNAGHPAPFVKAKKR